MNKKTSLNEIAEDNPIRIRNIGNFTAHAVKNFEENIVTQHNYLEKTGNK